MFATYFSGLFAAMAVLAFFYGFKQISQRSAIRLERFKTHGYNIDQDTEFLEKERQLKELEKLYKIDNTKKILLFITGALACGAIGYSISGKLHISLVSSLFGYALPAVFEKWHGEGRKIQMEKQFEEAAEQMAMVIKTGGSMHQAIERAAQEAKFPLKHELELMAAQTKLNMPLPEVFRLAKERIPVPEMEMLVMVASLQKTGMAVNISSVLERIQESIRARRIFREQIAAITAEGRLASKVVAVMPFIVIGFIRKAAPQFMDPLFTTVWGMALLAFSVVSIIAGMLWINKMMNIDM